MFNLVPWKQTARDELDTFRREVNGMFDRFFGGFEVAPFEKRNFVPTLDLSENEKEYVVKMELAGIEAKDIDICLLNDVLTIKGEKKEEKEEKGETFHRVERSCGIFSRSIRLPGVVKEKEINASFKDGLLKVSLPKSEAAITKKIEVKTT
ncbi:MAG: Hsp20/alpha crystallin family protein [Deltaproteobacteria bacterium]|nr:Hsp20/alpha crystallin family protein [Deltaproteobacteria bacterium]